jgi:hypothetical protein
VFLKPPSVFCEDLLEGCHVWRLEVDGRLFEEPMVGKKAVSECADRGGVHVDERKEELFFGGEVVLQVMAMKHDDKLGLDRAVMGPETRECGGSLLKTHGEQEAVVVIPRQQDKSRMALSHAGDLILPSCHPARLAANGMGGD